MVAQLKEELRDYEDAVAKGPAMPPGTEPDLGMRIILAHGDEVRPSGAGIYQGAVLLLG